MPLDEKLEKASAYGGKWAAYKTVNNLLSLGALVLSVTLDTQENEDKAIIQAQAALTYLSLATDAILATSYSIKLLNERIKKFDDGSRKIIGNYCSEHISNKCEFVLPLLGVVFGITAESIGLGVGDSYPTARKVLRTIAAPLSTVFFSAHADAIDNEIAKLEKIEEKNIHLAAAPAALPPADPAALPPADPAALPPADPAVGQQPAQVVGQQSASTSPNRPKSGLFQSAKASVEVSVTINEDVDKNKERKTPSPST
jgi:hypothetical protein